MRLHSSRNLMLNIPYWLVHIQIFFEFACILKRSPVWRTLKYIKDFSMFNYKPAAVSLFSLLWQLVECLGQFVKSDKAVFIFISLGHKVDMARHGKARRSQTIKDRCYSFAFLFLYICPRLSSLPFFSLFPPRSFCLLPSGMIWTRWVLRWEFEVQSVLL